MVKKYVYGNPIETLAVDPNADVKTSEDNFMQYLNELSANDKIIFTYTMEKSDIVYGLGEAARGINKRGAVYNSFCTDEPNQTEDKQSLWCS